MKTTAAENVEAAIEHFERLMSDDGDWIGVFENHDLGHPGVGQRIAFAFPADQWDKAELGKTHSPDHKAIGLGWRWGLVVKTRDPEEAARWLHDQEG
ncbi:MAG: hypothetical protein R3324_06060 [Halobacteriales archaeon]|nr:hypothetical protein [Halobacteriales archaeon]